MTHTQNAHRHRSDNIETDVHNVRFVCKNCELFSGIFYFGCPRWGIITVVLLFHFYDCCCSLRFSCDDFILERRKKTVTFDFHFIRDTFVISPSGRRFGKQKFVGNFSQFLFFISFIRSFINRIRHTNKKRNISIVHQFYFSHAK